MKLPVVGRKEASRRLLGAAKVACRYAADEGAPGGRDGRLVAEGAASGLALAAMLVGGAVGWTGEVHAADAAIGSAMDVCRENGIVDGQR